MFGLLQELVHFSVILTDFYTKDTFNIYQYYFDTSSYADKVDLKLFQL